MEEQPKVSKEDIELIRAFRKSPLVFIEKVWKLIPQPIKPEYKKLVDSLIETGKFQDLKKEYFESFIKNRHITWQQWQIFKAIERALANQAPRRISVRSGHGTGKSSSFAILILWFL